MDASQVKTLTQLRKELSLTDAANIRQIMAMFAHIAESHPEVVKESFGAYLKSRSEASQNAQVTWYTDLALHFKTLFNLD